MTTSPRSASEPQGSALLPFVLGLTFGLVIAAAIAMFVTGAPVPFVDRGILSNQNSERLPATAPMPRAQPPQPEPLVEPAPMAKPSASAQGSKQEKPAAAPVAGQPEAPARPPKNPSLRPRLNRLPPASSFCRLQPLSLLMKPSRCGFGLPSWALRPTSLRPKRMRPFSFECGLGRIEISRN